MFKIGNQLFTAASAASAKEIAALGGGTSLDLKFHDIPEMVAGAVLSAAAMTGVQLVNVHALGGQSRCSKQLCRPSVQAFRWARTGRVRLAVTLLTSMDQKTMKEVWDRWRSRSATW